MHQQPRQTTQTTWHTTLPNNYLSNFYFINCFFNVTYIVPFFMKEGVDCEQSEQDGVIVPSDASRHKRF